MSVAARAERGAGQRRDATLLDQPRGQLVRGNGQSPQHVGERMEGAARHRAAHAREGATRGTTRSGGAGTPVTIRSTAPLRAGASRPASCT